MSIGKITRHLMGENLFKIVGRYYRRIFVDLHKVAQLTVLEVPPNSVILDIGGGDGELLNHLLAMRDDVSVEMIDISSSLGKVIDTKFLTRVKKYPVTSIKDYLATSQRVPSTIVISDVLHHIPVSERIQFFRDLKSICTHAESPIFIIKDVEPYGFRAKLGYLADKYISGDNNVSLISRVELKEMIRLVFGQVEIRESALYQEDSPNYSFIFHSNHKQ